MGIIIIAVVRRLLMIYGIPLLDGAVAVLILLGLYIIGRKINRKNVIDTIEWIGIIGFLWLAIVAAFFLVMLFLYGFHGTYEWITEYKFIDFFSRL